MKMLLRSLVRVFPAPFREQFGSEMIDQIERDHDVARNKSSLAVMLFTLSTALDLTRSGIAERWTPTVVRPHTIRVGEKDMREKLMDWFTDLRYAVRALRRSPGFTTVAVGTLGLAIGANAGMFSVVNTVLINPLPYANVDRLVSLSATAPGSQMADEFDVSGEFFIQYKAQSKLIEDIAIYNSFTSTLRVDDRVERVRMSQPTNSLFSTLGARAFLGRTPRPEESEDVAVISYKMWSDWFGRDSAVIGRSYYMSGRERTVIGVMGPDFQFPREDVMLWISYALREGNIRVGDFSDPVIARIKPGTTQAALISELTTIGKGLPQRYGGNAIYAKTVELHRSVVKPITDQLIGPVASSLWVLLAAVGMVLIIACANVANLFLVRAEGRQRDLAVRRAIGATRSQLIRSQMSEALVIAVLAATLAVMLAWLSLPAVIRAAPRGVPRLSTVGMDGTTLLYTLVVAFVASLACGLIPAIKASAPDMRRLREGGRGSTRRMTWVRDGLVVGQTALALVLLIGSGLLVRSFAELRSINPGYDTKDVFTFQVAPEQAGLTGGTSYAQFHMQFMDRIRALPGVTSVGIVENVPLNEGTSSSRFRGDDGMDMTTAPALNFTFSAGDYFKTMGIKVRDGRAFTNDDQLVNHGNVMISKSAAELLWPGKDAIGRRLQRNRDPNWYTVIGVVDDVRQNGYREAPQALVYYSLVGPTDSSWAISSPAYVVKTSRAKVIGPEIRAIAREISPFAPMYRTYTMDELAATSMVQLSFTMLALGIASTLALILGAVGLYGVLSYVVAGRTREIGVRLALGAETGQVRRMVVGQGARIVLAGVVVGAVVAGISARSLGSLLFGVAAFDPTTFVSMSLSLIGVGMLASYVPARRASNVDPIESLRGD